MDRMLFAGVVAVALMTPVATTFAAEHTRDTPADVKRAVAEGRAVIIDVREVDEWQAGHLKDAQNLPLSQLRAGVPAERLKALIPPGKIVYLHCAAGGRCLRAADLLQAAGYATRPLKPGYDDLLRAGLEKAR